MLLNRISVMGTVIVACHGEFFPGGYVCHSYLGRAPGKSRVQNKEVLSWQVPGTGACFAHEAVSYYPLPHSFLLLEFFLVINKCYCQVVFCFVLIFVFALHQGPF